MSSERYHIMPAFSLTPNKLALFTKFIKRDSFPSDRSVMDKASPVKLPVGRNPQLFDNPEMFRVFDNGLAVKDAPVTEKKVRNSVSHNFELSKQARKNLRDKVTWLYHFAKKQTIKTVNGKQLSNFRMNFVTLKLPSEQMHTSDFITKNCLNQLLTEISAKTKMVNYVWRLEYQKNGNLHYHLATDTYIDYYFLRKTWNRILNKYGYVDNFTRKFEKMSFNEYYQYTVKNYPAPFDEIKARFDNGFKTQWKEPNTVDCKSVIGSKNIAFYISKYMSKKEDSSVVKKLPVCEDNSSNSRLWFCSRSLSRAKSVVDFCEAFETDLVKLLIDCEKVKKVVSDYAVCFYFCITELPYMVQKQLNKIFWEYRRLIAYDS